MLYNKYVRDADADDDDDDDNSNQNNNKLTLMYPVSRKTKTREK